MSTATRANRNPVPTVQRLRARGVPARASMGTRGGMVPAILMGSTISSIEGMRMVPSRRPVSTSGS
jgi:hypothetical protein